jgi:hypothetical protein
MGEWTISGFGLSGHGLCVRVHHLLLLKSIMILRTDMVAYP